MKKILLIEDDLSLGQGLSRYLEGEQFQITWHRSLEEARKDNLSSYSILILDWMLPDGQGIDFLKEVRAKKIEVPVIMLTARSDLIDKVVGLESGANDYLTKPFEPRELLARIRVQMRDIRPAKASLELNDVRLDLDTRTLFFNDEKVETTKMEFELLKLLLETPERVFSREEILNKVWGLENYPTTRTVDTHILQLRQKTRENLIETVRGVGYRLIAKN